MPLRPSNPPIPENVLNRVKELEAIDEQSAIRTEILHERARIVLERANQKPDPKPSTPDTRPVVHIV